MIIRSLAQIDTYRHFCLRIVPVIGCDGIKSRLRRIMFGEHHPASHPGYNHRFCYRGVVPMDSVVAALGGRYTPSARAMYSGPDAHMVA